MFDRRKTDRAAAAVTTNFAKSVKAIAKNPPAEQSLTQQSEAMTRSVRAVAKRRRRNDS